MALRISDMGEYPGKIDKNIMGSPITREVILVRGMALFENYLLALNRQNKFSKFSAG
jgi:hypothetical protein